MTGPSPLPGGCSAGPDSIELPAGCRVSVTGAVTNQAAVAAGNRSEGVSVSSAPAALPLR
jgi:hypothetical protein